MNPFEIPGCVFIGYTQAENVNDGQPVPLFEPAPPPAGRLSINTLEGWTQAANAHNLRSFRKMHGRDPVDNDEIMRWMYPDAKIPSKGELL